MDNSEWWVTVVCGPQADQQKLEFLGEIRAMSWQWAGPIWAEWSAKEACGTVRVTRA